MQRRDFLKTVAASVPSLAQGAQKSQPKLPNIVFILADDIGYGDVRCFHPESKIPTPNIDRMAQEGMRFTDAHSPSGVCSPTRYGVLDRTVCLADLVEAWCADGLFTCNDSAGATDRCRVTEAAGIPHRGRG